MNFLSCDKDKVTRIDFNFFQYTYHKLKLIQFDCMKIIMPTNNPDTF